MPEDVARGNATCTRKWPGKQPGWRGADRLRLPAPHRRESFSNSSLDSALFRLLAFFSSPFSSTAASTPNPETEKLLQFPAHADSPINPQSSCPSILHTSRPLYTEPDEESYNNFLQNSLREIENPGEAAAKITATFDLADSNISESHLY